MCVRWGVRAEYRKGWRARPSEERGSGWEGTGHGACAGLCFLHDDLLGLYLSGGSPTLSPVCKARCLPLPASSLGQVPSMYWHSVGQHLTVMHRDAPNK